MMKQGKLIVIIGFNEFERSNILFSGFCLAKNQGTKFYAQKPKKVINPFANYIKDVEIIEPDKNTKFIFIDDAHLFEGIIGKIEDLLAKGIVVWVAGELISPEGSIYDDMVILTSMADDVLTAHKRCDYCSENLAKTCVDGDFICIPCALEFYEKDSEDIYSFDLKVEGFNVHLDIPKIVLEQAGYTKEEVEDIETMEGIYNLINDLGMKLYEEGDY